MSKPTIVAIVAALTLAGSVGLGAGRVSAQGGLKVDDDKVQCPDAPYTTIQAAVTAAAGLPGKQAIRVCPGTYVENVLIGANNSLEIFGDGMDKVTVRPVPGTPGPAFDALDSGSVTIEKLTVDGQSALTGNSLGIRYQQTSGRIKDTAVLNIRDAAGAGQSVGIRINSTGPNVNVRVEDNLVRNWTRVGVLGNGPGVNIHVEDNSIRGPVAPKVHAPNGVQISRGAEALVKGNEVRDASIGIVPPNAGSGILLFCPGPTVVEGNKIFSSDTGVNLEDASNARVIGNETTGSAFDAYPLLSGVAVFFGLNVPFPVGCPGGPQATANNLLEGNKASTSGRDGVHLEAFAAQPGPSNNRVFNTEVRTSVRDGIRIDQGAGNRVVNNSMQGSGEHDAHDETVGTGTGGTANTWTNNECKSPNKQNKPGLCKN